MRLEAAAMKRIINGFELNWQPSACSRSSKPRRTMDIVWSLRRPAKDC